MGEEVLAVATSIDNEEVEVGVPRDLEEEWIMGEGGSESHPRVEEVS